MSTMTVDNALEDMARLRAVDRCDGCGAQAYVRAHHPNKAHELLFCGHDYARHAAKLKAEGWLIYDQRADLTRRD